MPRDNRNTELDTLWERAKHVRMTRDEQDEQMIQDVAANGNISDPRITEESVRAIHDAAKRIDAEAARIAS